MCYHAHSQSVFKWELRVFYLLPVGIVAHIILVEAGNAVLCTAAVFMIIMHAYFSIGITGIFLEKITDALASDRVKKYTQAANDLRRTKRVTMIGAFVTVLGMSLFYLNTILYVAFKGPFNTIVWLNPLVFGSSVASVVTGVGIFLISGASAGIYGMHRRVRNAPALAIQDQDCSK